MTDTTTARVRLGETNYGKADVRLLKVFREGKRHRVKDLNVRVALLGSFEGAHVQGDNTGLLATDTVRNTVYALAKDELTGSVEGFGRALIRHFVGVGPTVTGARVWITEHGWDRITVDGQPHDHAFTRAMPKHTAYLEGDGQTIHVTSGIDELLVLKTTNSGWAGFHRERFTTLPDTSDRILSTVVTSRWEYGAEDVDHDAVWQTVYDQILQTFTDHYSPSVQNTLYRMGEAVLGRVPEISRIHFSFPNKHHLLYNLERFGIENRNEVFHVDPEPYGLIEGWVERA